MQESSWHENTCARSICSKDILCLTRSLSDDIVRAWRVRLGAASLEAVQRFASSVEGWGIDMRGICEGEIYFPYMDVTYYFKICIILFN